jgi:hypothetical protein
MNRRGFLKDATELGIAGGVAGTLLDKQAAAATAVPQAPESHSLPNREEMSDEIAAPVIDLSGQWMIVRDPQNVGREQHWFARPVADGKTLLVKRLAFALSPETPRRTRRCIYRTIDYGI